MEGESFRLGTAGLRPQACARGSSSFIEEWKKRLPRASLMVIAANMKLLSQWHRYLLPTHFLIPQGALLAKKWGYRRELVGVFGSNVPLALLIDP